jgi:uncharacterized protein YjbI with pentapeptide repeats
LNEKRYALIVTTPRNDYADPLLSSKFDTIEDSDEFTRVIGNSSVGSFDVKEIRSSPSQVVCGELEKFFYQSEPYDNLLLYLSCPALVDENGETYFACRDTDPKLPNSTSVSANFITKMVRSCKSKHIIILLDCFYLSTPNSSSDGAMKFGRKIKVSDVLGDTQAVILSSSNTLTDASSGVFQSRFTKALVDGIKTGNADLNQDGLITHLELWDYLQGVLGSSSSDQELSMVSFVSEEFILAKNPSLVIEEPPMRNGQPGLTPASPEIFLKLLQKENVVEFNKKRQEFPIELLDIGNASLLQWKNISGANLSYTNFVSADFRNSTIKNADLFHANLKKANLSGATLTGSKFSHTNLQETDLRNADLSGADLHESDLRNADLSGANLQMANLEGNDLIGANLAGANLAGANLTSAILTGANLRNTNFSGAKLKNAKFGSSSVRTELTGAILKNSDLSGADLSGADLSGVDLSGAVATNSILSRAILIRSTLYKTDLRRANLEHADLSGANLEHANLDGARLKYVDLTGAKLENTKFTKADLCYANFKDTNLSTTKIAGATLNKAKNLPITIEEAKQRKASFSTYLSKIVGKLKREDCEKMLTVDRLNLKFAATTASENITTISSKKINQLEPDIKEKIIGVASSLDDMQYYLCKSIPSLDDETKNEYRRLRLQIILGLNQLQTLLVSFIEGDDVKKDILKWLKYMSELANHVRTSAEMPLDVDALSSDITSNDIMKFQGLEEAELYESVSKDELE